MKNKDCSLEFVHLVGLYTHWNTMHCTYNVKVLSGVSDFNVPTLPVLNAITYVIGNCEKKNVFSLRQNTRYKFGCSRSKTAPLPSFSSDCVQVHIQSEAHVACITDTCNRLRREIQGYSSYTYIYTMIMINSSLVYISGRRCLYNLETRPCNRCCCGKAISSTYSECVFVNLGVQYSMCMRHIVIRCLSGSTTLFQNIS
jgi:hypothetical protein